MKTAADKSSIYQIVLLLAISHSIFCSNSGSKPIVFNHNVEPDVVYYTNDKQRIRGFSNKESSDIVVGAIFPVHNSQGGGVCKPDVVFAETTDYMEAVLYAVDMINNDDDLLPNITLGYDLRDSCITENIGLEETVDMVLQTGGDGGSCTGGGTGSGNDDDDGPSTDSYPVSVIIGDYASFISVPVASFLRVFSVPQVSVATSVLLNNRERFSYFYRTVPADDQQTQAIIDLVLHFGWNYVSTLHSNDLYGEPGIDNFRNLANKHGICIGLDEGIDDNTKPEEYTALARRVYNSSTQVIVFFSSFNQVDELMQYLLEIQSTSPNKKSFVWIAGDTWADSAVVFSKYESLVRGMWGIIPQTRSHVGFEQYFSSLTVNNNLRNQWFKEYHQYYYDCGGNETCNYNISIEDNEDYKTNSFTPFVIDAVYSFAHALNAFINDNCDKPIMWNNTENRCKGQRNALNGTALRDYLRQVNFTSVTENLVFFDETGSIEGRYSILNYQLDEALGDYRNVLAADWDQRRPSSKRLEFVENVTFQFGVDEHNEPVRVLESQCRNCPSGMVYRPVSGSCCGTCSPCLGQGFSNTTDSSTECFVCPLYMWGDSPLNGSKGCMRLEESFLNFQDPWGIILIAVGIIGIVSVILVSIGLLALWNKSVIKSSGREQMMLLLIGIACCFLSTVFYILKPSVPVCLLQRLLTWLSFSIILSALFIKLVRIARIFLRGNRSKRPRFIQPYYQIFFTFILVGIQLIFVLVSLLIVYPETSRSIILNSQDANDYPTLVLKCNPPHPVMIGVQMLFYAVLLVSSNALAMITIRFPANFNEVRYVAFCTFAIGLIWLTFIIAHFTTSDEYRGAILSFAIQLSALTVLVSMFATRLCVQMCFPNQSQVTDPSPSMIITRDRRTSSVAIIDQKQDTVNGVVNGGNEESLKVKSPVTVTFSELS